MKPILILTLSSFFCLMSIVPVRAIMAPDNPVHQRLKAFEDHNMEIYGPSSNRLMTSTEKVPEKTASVNSTFPGETEFVTREREKREKIRFTELMKEFDKDGDGMISDEEMAAAKKAGKDDELKKLLEKYPPKKTEGTETSSTPDNPKPSESAPAPESNSTAPENR